MKASLINSLKNLFVDNPVLIRDLRSRMRGIRMLIFITLYVLIICTATFLYTLFSLNQLSITPMNPNQLSNIGGVIYQIILYISIVIVVIFSPMNLSGVVAGEKEKQTFDFIRVTTLTPWRYILGYILANTLFITLLIFCTLPVISLAFVFGGVSPDEVIYAYILLICLAILLSSFAIMISALRKNVRTAQTTTLAVLFLAYFLLGPIIGFINHSLGTNLILSSLPDLLLGKTYFIGIHLPNILLIIIITAYLFSFFYIIASRKLYNIEVKSFSYRQFIGFFLIADFILFSLFWKQPTIQSYSLLFIVSSIMILIAVFNFSPDVIEIGDESWKLKNKIKLFRNLDEDVIFTYAIFFFQLFLFLVYFYANSLYTFPNATSLWNIQNVRGTLAIGHITQSFLILFILITLMTSIAKLASQIMKTRIMAVRVTLASFLIIFVFFPFIALIFYASIEGNQSIPAAILKMTPYVALTKILGSDLYIRIMKTIDEALFYIDPILLNFIIYIPISLVIIFIANHKRKKSKAKFLRLFSESPFQTLTEDQPKI